MAGETPDPLRRLRELSKPGVLLDPDVLARVLEVLPDAVIVIDQERIIRFINAQAELIFGYPRQLLHEQQIDVLLPEPVRATHAEHIQKFFLEPRSRPMGFGRPLEGRRSDGTLISLDIMLGPVVSTHGVYGVAVVRPRRS